MNYALASLVSLFLAGMGITALYFGVRNIIDRNRTETDFQMLYVCICVFFWDFGYAWMSMCYYSDFAYVPRAVSLLAVSMYMLFMIGYVALVSKFPKKKLIIPLSVVILLVLVSWPQIIAKDAVTFTMTPWGYWYYSKMTSARLLQFLSIAVSIVQYYFVIHYGLKNAKTKRDKSVYKSFVWFGPILVVGYLFDTLIPTAFQMAAVPGSGISAFIAAMIMFNVARMNKMHGLTKDNVSQYVFDDVKVPVFITDTDGKIVLFNNHAPEFFGIEPEKLKGQLFFSLFTKGEDGIYVINPEEKSEKVCMVDDTDIYDKFEEKLFSIYFVRDITEANRAFRLMRKSKEEAEEANRAKSDFLANMSHEIRTPMNAIIGMSQIVLDNKELPENIVNQVNEIKIAGTNLLDIINDVLDMSKIEAGKIELIKEEYDLAILIHEISSVINARLDKSEVRFILDIDKTLPRYILGDVGRVRQILMNVIGNAIKFTMEGSITLKISWNRNEESPVLYFDVTDTGIGIKAEDKEKIFGKYDQADSRKNRNVQGTGLGLAISRNLAVLMGGMITVESVYGKGSTFHIVIAQGISNKYVELGDKTSEELKSKTFIIPVKREIEVIKRPEMRVLVVDDSNVNLLVAKGLMKKYEMQIDTALCGKKSIDKVQENYYDIVFMDHMMPEMDGVDTMKNIRELGDKYKKLPMVALTANALNESRDYLLGEGFDDFLAKPINVVELDRVINKYAKA